MTGPGRLLVAGIGNIFLGDDGFGVEVAARLTGRLWPDGVRVADYGIRGVHLAYELLDGYDGLVLIDAVPMGEPPGTVAVIEPGPGGTLGFGEEAVIDAHSMNPVAVLGTLARLGGTVGYIRVVGCQPARLEEGMGLSAPVAGAVDGAEALCRELVDDFVKLAGKGA